MRDGKPTGPPKQNMRVLVSPVFNSRETNSLVIVKMYIIHTTACDPYEWNIPPEYNSAEVYGTQAWEISYKSDEMIYKARNNEMMHEISFIWSITVNNSGVDYQSI